MSKKKGNYNIMATYSYHMIAFILISYIILLSLLVVLIYHLFLPDYISIISNFIDILIKIDFFLLYYWNIPARYYIIEKCISLSFYYNFDFYLLIFRLDLFYLNPLKFRSFHKVLQSKKTYKVKLSSNNTCVRRI